MTGCGIKDCRNRHAVFLSAARADGWLIGGLAVDEAVRQGGMAGAERE